MARTQVPGDAAERVRVSGEQRFFAGIGLCLAGFLGWLAWQTFVGTVAASFAASGEALGGASGAIQGTPRYVAGEWGGRVAAMAWCAVLASAAAWLTGANLRRAIGIPVPLRKPRTFLTTLRVCAIAAILFRMLVWRALGGHGARFAGIDITPETALMNGLVLCALAGLELPAWLARGFRCLRARIPALMGQRATLGTLPAQGRVRVTGTIEPEGLPHGIAYRRVWNPVTHALELEGQPFQLRDGGHRVWIDLDPARAVVDVAPAPDSPDARGTPAGQPGTAAPGVIVHAGTRVDEVGYLVESPDGAYRGGARRIDAGHGLLYVLGGTPQWNRRLLVAGLVELAAAAVLLAAPLSLFVAWAVARWHL
jgi:hypothetical protein